MPFNRTLVLLVRVAIALLFLWAALGKLFLPTNPRTMYGALIQRTRPLGVLLPVIEIVLALWVLSGFWRQRAAYAVLFTLCLFTAAIVFNLAQKQPKPCGCLSAEQQALLSPSHVRFILSESLARNILFIGGAIFLLRDADRKRFGVIAMAQGKQAMQPPQEP